MQMWDTLARHNWSGDAPRIDDLTQSFCEVGELEARGMKKARGRAEISAFLGGVARRRADLADGVKQIVRHNLTNIRFTVINRERASVASYFTVLTEIGLDH